MATISVRTDTILKENALKVFNTLGMDMSTAVNVFLSQVVLRQAIPFDLSISPSNPDQKANVLSLFGSIDDPTFCIADTTDIETPREVLV